MVAFAMNIDAKPWIISNRMNSSVQRIISVLNDSAFPKHSSLDAGSTGSCQACIFTCHKYALWALILVALGAMVVFLMHHFYSKGSISMDAVISPSKSSTIDVASDPSGSTLVDIAFDSTDHESREEDHLSNTTRIIIVGALSVSCIFLFTASLVYGVYANEPTKPKLESDGDIELEHFAKREQTIDNNESSKY